MQTSTLGIRALASVLPFLRIRRHIASLLWITQCPGGVLSYRLLNNCNKAIRKRLFDIDKDLKSKYMTNIQDYELSGNIFSVSKLATKNQFPHHVSAAVNSTPLKGIRKPWRVEPKLRSQCISFKFFRNLHWKIYSGFLTDTEIRIILSSSNFTV